MEPCDTAWCVTQCVDERAMKKAGSMNVKTKTIKVTLVNVDKTEIEMSQSDIK